MEFLLSLLLGTRLLTLLGGGIGHDGGAVAFSPPRIVIMRDEILLNCRLINAYPDDLTKLARTATPVYIYLFAELREEGGRRSAKKAVAESSLVYDMLAKTFLVVHGTRPDTIRYGSLDSALGASCDFRNVRLASVGDIKKEAGYFVAAFAVLGKTRVEALNNKEIDLMYYWNFKRPSFKTETIKGKNFLIK